MGDDLHILSMQATTQAEPCYGTIAANKEEEKEVEAEAKKIGPPLDQPSVMKYKVDDALPLIVRVNK